MTVGVLRLHQCGRLPRGIRAGLKGTDIRSGSRTTFTVFEIPVSFTIHEFIKMSIRKFKCILNVVEPI